MKDLLLTSLIIIVFLQNLGWREDFSYGTKFVLTVFMFFFTLIVITELRFYFERKRIEKSKFKRLMRKKMI